MKGDFTRMTFDPAKRYIRVFEQQGRVQVDSDWNEMNDIHRHLLRRLACRSDRAPRGTGRRIRACGSQRQGQQRRVARFRHLDRELLCRRHPL
jgi:hypothetical protein